MVLVSSGTHLVKNHEFLSQKKESKIENLGPLCNQQLIRRQKSHEQDIVTKNHFQIDRSFFASYRTQDAEETKSRLSKSNKMNLFYSTA